MNLILRNHYDPEIGRVLGLGVRLGRWSIGAGLFFARSWKAAGWWYVGQAPTDWWWVTQWQARLMWFVVGIQREGIAGGRVFPK